MKVYVARSVATRSRRDGAWTCNDDHGGDEHKMMDMMIKWRRRI
jgi:hypothetical protein